MMITSSALVIAPLSHGQATGPSAPPRAPPGGPAPAPTSPQAPLGTTPSGAPAEPAPIPPLPSEAIVAPKLMGEAVVEYPAGAVGASTVILELLIGVEGDVRDARVVEGAEPFAAAALAAARSWRFEPARVQGQRRAARIRFVVSFSPPVDGAPAPEPPVSTPARAPSPAPRAPIAVTVLGRRQEPLAQTLSRAEVRQLPGAFGDPFRAIEALPGVTPILSGVPFFYVRGAPPGNVGYFLDGIRLPVLYHAGLGPSVVHPAMVSRVDLYPGAYPTRFGRFSGGIVAGEVQAPLDHWHGEWQIRLFDAGAMAEAPFAEGRGHVLVGGRYSYTAYLISLLGEDARLEYWDYQLRAGYRLGASDALSVFAFGSFDYFGEDTSDTDDALFSTEFHRIDVRHDHDFSDATRLRSAFTWGFDRTRVGEDSGYALDRRLSLRSELESQLGPSLRLSAGADVVTDAYSIDAVVDDDGADDVGPAGPDPNDIGGPPPFEDDGSEIDDEDTLRRLFPSRRDWVAGAHVNLDIALAGFVNLVPGLRFDAYVSEDTLALSLEPRISAEFRVSRNLTLKNALGLAAQPPSFVVPVAGFDIGGLPGGLQRSVQSSAGAEYRLPDAMKLSLTFFHNAFFDMTDLLSLVRVEDLEDDLQLDTRSHGQAYGMELMFHRDLTRRLGGFLSYTLSRSQRFRNNRAIAAAFDRTHVLNAALGYDLGRRWRAGGRFVFYTGNPELAFGEPTPSRLPPFHRIDLRLEKRWPLGSDGGYWAFILEVLNATLSTEVVAQDCDDDGECDPETIGPITIPSIAFEGRF